MTDLRKAVIDVLDSYAAINATETSECYSFALCSHEQSIEALRTALAETPSIDALITEIDILEIVERDGRDWLRFHEVQDILDKYRAKDKP